MSCQKKIRPQWIPLAYANADVNDKLDAVAGVKPSRVIALAQIVRSHKKKSNLR